MPAQCRHPPQPLRPSPVQHSAFSRPQVPVPLVPLTPHAKSAKSAKKGNAPEQNAAITRAVLSGREQGGKRTAVLMNAGAALYIADKAPSIAEGIKLAAELIDSGAALEKLEAFAAASNR